LSTGGDGKVKSFIAKPVYVLALPLRSPLHGCELTTQGDKGTAPQLRISARGLILRAFAVTAQGL